MLRPAMSYSVLRQYFGSRPSIAVIPGKAVSSTHVFTEPRRPSRSRPDIGIPSFSDVEPVPVCVFGSSPEVQDAAVEYNRRKTTRNASGNCTFFAPNVHQPRVHSHPGRLVPILMCRE